MEELSISALVPVIEALKPESPQEQPLLCDKVTFSKIYQLEKRRQNRDFSSSYLTHIKITNGDNRVIELKELDQLMLHILKGHIRSGDAISRWGEKHFAVLLYDIGDRTNVEVVEQRIKYFFYKNRDQTDGVEIHFRSFSLNNGELTGE